MERKQFTEFSAGGCVQNKSCVRDRKLNYPFGTSGVALSGFIVVGVSAKKSVMWKIKQQPKGNRYENFEN